MVLPDPVQPGVQLVHHHGRQVLDGDAVLLGQSLGDQRAVAGLWVALDTDSAAVPLLGSPQLAAQ